MLLKWGKRIYCSLEPYLIQSASKPHMCTAENRDQYNILQVYHYIDKKFSNNMLRHTIHKYDQLPYKNHPENAKTDIDIFVITIHGNSLSQKD